MQDIVLIQDMILYLDQIIVQPDKIVKTVYNVNKMNVLLCQLVMKLHIC